MHDLVGKIQQVSDATGTYDFAYDNLGRLIATEADYSFLTSRTFTVEYAYDAASNRTEMTDPEGGVTAYVYDNLNRLTTLTPPSAFASGNFGFAYDALSRRTRMTRPNGVTTDYAYDTENNLTKIKDALLRETQFAYDPRGRVTQVTFPSALYETYIYDAVGNSGGAGSFS